MEIMQEEIKGRMQGRAYMLKEIYNYYFKTEGKLWWKPSKHDFETKSALNYMKDLQLIKGEDNSYMITSNGIKVVESGAAAV